MIARRQSPGLTHSLPCGSDLSRVGALNRPRHGFWRMFGHEPWTLTDGIASDCPASRASVVRTGWAKRRRTTMKSRGVVNVNEEARQACCRIGEGSTLRFYCGMAPRSTQPRRGLEQAQLQRDRDAKAAAGRAGLNTDAGVVDHRATRWLPKYSTPKSLSFLRHM